MPKKERPPAKKAASIRSQIVAQATLALVLLGERNQKIESSYQRYSLTRIFSLTFEDRIVAFRDVPGQSGQIMTNAAASGNVSPVNWPKREPLPKMFSRPSKKQKRTASMFIFSE